MSLILVSKVNKNAFDGGNRLRQGFKYRIVEILLNKHDYNGEAELPAVLVEPEYGPTGAYPHAWALTNFENVRT